MNSTPTDHPPVDFDSDDRLVLPHFEERLLESLHDGQRSGGWARSTIAVRLRDNDEGSWRGSGTQWARRVLVAAVVLVAVAVGAAVVPRGDDVTDVDVGTVSEPPPQPQPQPEPEPDAADTELRDRIVGAIDEALATSVVHSLDANGAEFWVDDVSGAERRSFVAGTGGRRWDWGWAVAPAVDDPGARPEQALSRIVDHCLLQYSDAEQPSLWMGSAASTLRGELAQDHYAPDGTELVDGRELIRWREVGSSIDEEPTRVVYIDPDMLLPVRVVDAGDDSTTTIEYLPRSPESLALLVPPIPDGFTQIADMPTNDVAATVGC